MYTRSKMDESKTNNPRELEKKEYHNFRACDLKDFKI